MGRGAVGVGIGEVIGRQHVVAHLFTADFSQRPDGAHPRDPPVGEVRQDPQQAAGTGPFLELRCQGLGHAVNRIGAHGVAGIDDDVDHGHRAFDAVDHADIQIAEAAAEFQEQRIGRVADLLDLVETLQHFQAHVLRIAGAQ